MKTLYKPLVASLFYAALILFITWATPATAEIQPGDVAIIRVHGNMDETKDGFTWLALRDFETEELKWTDSGWGYHIDGEAPEGWHKGESTDDPLLGGLIAAGTIGELYFERVFPTTGDQLFLFTGLGPKSGSSRVTEEEAGFVWGMQWGIEGGWITSGLANTNAESYAPQELESLGMTVALGQGTHWYYSGSTTGTTEQLLSRIRNPDNWSLANNDSSSWNEVRGESFSIQAVPEPSVMALGAGVACLGVVALQRRRRRS